MSAHGSPTGSASQGGRTTWWRVSKGVHRTDIALCLYWVFYAADKGIASPPLRGYLKEKGRKPDKIIRALNEFYRCKTERDDANPIPEEVFKERKDFICIMNKNDNQ